MKDFTRNTLGRLCFDDEELLPGPWHNEPDELTFEHAGFSCLLLRGPNGCWCGYLAVPVGHVWYGVERDRVHACVHGGLTYGGSEHAAGRELDGRWWFGFDCNHADDLNVYHERLSYQTERDAWYAANGLPNYKPPVTVYRTVSYARAELEKLAEQARDSPQLRPSFEATEMEFS